MMRLSRFLRNVARDAAGSTVIETALIVPVLLTMGLGTMDVSRIMARQNELQKATNEVADIALAATPDTDTKKQTLKSIIMTSTGLSSDKVQISTIYRCGTATSFTEGQGNCASGEKQYTFIRVTLTDTVTPMWTNFGVGAAIPIRVVRQIQTS